MKTTKFYLPVFITLMLLPFLSEAQWNAVRWDVTNNFEKVFAITSNTAFVIGAEPVNNEYFIIRTNDGGTTWDSIAVNSPNNTFQLREMLFLDVNTGFVGGVKNNNQVLLKTTDNGNTWTEITPNASSPDPILSVSFFDSQNGFATDGTILYKTINGGAGWSMQSPSFQLNDLSFFDANNGFACGNAGSNAVIMKTVNGGLTWSASLNISNTGSSGISFNKIDFIDSDIGFTSYLNKLYRTQDGGSSWDTIATPDKIWDFDFTTNTDTGYILTRHGTMVPDSSDLCSTFDGGQNWNMDYTTGWNFYGGGVTLNSISFIDQTGFAAGTSGLVKKYIFTSVGVNENETTNTTISLYPNPFSSNLSLKIRSQVDNEWQLNIYNNLDQVIYNAKLSSDQMVMNVPPDLPKGIYFYKIFSDNNEVYAGKIIKQ